MLVPGPAQAAGVVALDDDAHVEPCSAVRYRERLELMAGAVSRRGPASTSPLPAGGFYLWFPVGDGWDFTDRLAREGGALVSPGELYGRPRVPTTSASPWYNLSTVSTSSSSA